MPLLRTPGRPPGERRTGRRLVRLAALGSVALLATGCTGEPAKWSRGGFPAPVTVQGKSVLHLWQGTLIASLIVGGLVIGMIVWAAIFFRRRGDDHIPRQVRYNLPIEVLYTFIPIVVVSVLFYFTAIGENNEDAINNKPALQLGVVGFQWSWQFNYLGSDLSITGRPGQPPQLVLPIGEQVHFYLTSPDVIHSFWVVPFLFKRDVIPDHPNHFAITATQTGTYTGHCSELCGLYHARMLFTLKVVTPQQFQAYMAAQQAAQSSSGSTQ